MSLDRAFAEATHPRPTAIVVANGVIVLDKIVWWAWVDGDVSLSLLDDHACLRVPDPDRKIDAALRQLFRVVTP